jgi:hypothetical protein
MLSEVKKLTASDAALRDAGLFKDAVNKYKDALSKAESAIQ